jgi:hypothetical protein
MRGAALVFVVAAAASWPARADAVDCEGGAVFAGQGAADLLGKCGEPSDRDERVDERSSFVFDPSSQASEVRKVRVLVARWTYDFGPNRFVQIVTLENGRIVSLERRGYGSAAAAPRPARVAIARCDAQLAFHVGDMAYEVLARCGEPVARELKQVERQVAAPDVTGIVYGNSATVDVETWTYNFGARMFQRRVKFVNGRVVDIATGGYGYGEPNL